MIYSTICNKYFFLVDLFNFCKTSLILIYSICSLSRIFYHLTIGHLFVHIIHEKINSTITNIKTNIGSNHQRWSQEVTKWNKFSGWGVLLLIKLSMHTNSVHGWGAIRLETNS